MQRKLIGYTKLGRAVYEIAGGAVTHLWYGLAFTSVFNKLIDLDGDTLKAILATSSYTPNQDTHDFYNDITNELSTGSGYTSGGTTLTSVTASASQYTGGTNTWAYDADDALWTTSTLTARYCAIYDSTPGTAATDPLLSYVDFGADQSSSSGDFRVAWNASGVARVVVS